MSVALLPTARCIHCNYQLQQLRELRCPECGHAFDPDDDSSVNTGRELTPASRWALAPPGRIASSALVAGALAAAWFERLPPPLEDRSVFNGSLLIFIGCIWIFWPLARRFVARLNAWNITWFTAHRRPIIWPGMVALAIGVGIICGAPRWLAFKCSEPAMNRVAQQMVLLRKSAIKDERLGVFLARSILPIPGGAIFTTAREQHGESGFVYLPAANPKSTTWNSRTYIADGWWTWREMR